MSYKYDTEQHLTCSETNENSRSVANDKHGDKLDHAIVTSTDSVDKNVDTQSNDFSDITNLERAVDVLPGNDIKDGRPGANNLHITTVAVDSRHETLDESNDKTKGNEDDGDDASKALLNVRKEHEENAGVTLKWTINEKNNDEDNARRKYHSESEHSIGFEAVLIELGSPGKFTLFQILMNVSVVFILSNTILSYVFIGYEPPHTCMAVANESELLSQYGLSNSTGEIRYEECAIRLMSNASGQDQTVATLDCVNGHDYKGQQHISFVSEWDLVCGNVGLKEMVQTIVLVGQTFGGLIFTSIGDKFGRKPVYIGCNALLGAAGFAAAFAPNIYILIGIRFVTGLAQQGSGILSFTIIMEWLIARHRRMAGVYCGLNWSGSLLVLALIAYLMRDYNWRTLMMVLGLFGCNVLLFPFLLTESPRWLVANERYDEALAILKKASRMNRKDFGRIQQVFNTHVRLPEYALSKDGKIMPDVATRVSEQYSVLDILRHKELLICSLILWLTWISNACTYYGLYMASSSLSGNRHVNFFLMTVVDVPSDITNLIALAYFGRKRVIMTFLALTGAALFTATMLMALGTSHVTGTLSTVFSLLGKYCIAACFNGIYIYTPELFPTNLRSAGLGVCSSVARLGGMIAPYTEALADVVLWGPGTLFAGMCFLSGILFYKLPETRGRPMPTTVADMKGRVGKKSPKIPNLSNFEVETEISAPQNTLA